MTFLVTAVVALSVAIGLMLVVHLVKVIQVLRSITAQLATARLLLLTTTVQTEPAGELVGDIGANVTTLHELVTGVARSLGLPLRGAR